MRTLPNGRATNAAVGTSGAAFAIASAPYKTRQIKIKTDAQAYVGMGSASSPPAASETNSTYHESGELVYTLDDATQSQGIVYVYVYSLASTLTAFVSFYG